MQRLCAGWDRRWITERAYFFVGLFVLLLAAGCGLRVGGPEQELEGVPGGYLSSEGESAYWEQYQEAIGLLETGAYGEAEALYRELIEREPERPHGYIGLGSSLYLQGLYAEAQVAYGQALDIAPDSVDALIGLGSATHATGDREQAADYYAQAVALDPAHLEARWALANILLQLGRTEEAVEHLEQVVSLAPDSELAASAREALRERGE